MSDQPNVEQVREALVEFEQEYEPSRHARTQVYWAAREWLQSQAGESITISREADGEWPLDVRTLLNSWGHRWPAQSAEFILDLIADHLALGGVDVGERP